MRISVVIFILATIIAGKTEASDADTTTEAGNPRILVILGNGINFPLSFYKTGSDVDYLMPDLRNTYCLDFGMGINLLNNFGVEFSLFMNIPFYKLNNTEKYEEAFIGKHSEDFYVREPNIIEYQDETSLPVNLNTGLYYIYSFDDYFIIPKFSMGITFFGSNDKEFFLKERGSNTLLNYFISDDSSLPLFATFSGSVGLGWRLEYEKYLYLNFRYSQFNLDLTVKDELKNIYTKDIIERNEYNYNSRLRSFSVTVVLLADFNLFVNNLISGNTNNGQQ
jgi:hypothetical protein